MRECENSPKCPEQPVIDDLEQAGHDFHSLEYMNARKLWAWPRCLGISLTSRWDLAQSCWNLVAFVAGRQGESKREAGTLLFQS